MKLSLLELRAQPVAHEEHSTRRLNQNSPKRRVDSQRRRLDRWHVSDTGPIVGGDDVLSRYRRHQGDITSQVADTLEDALVVQRRIAASFDEASRRWRPGDRRAAPCYVLAAAGAGGFRRTFSVALRLVRVEIGRRQVRVTVPR
jgi:hypothetical protein